MAEYPLELFEGTKVPVTFYVVEDDGSVFNLTGYSVDVIVHSNDPTVADGSNEIEADCDTDDAANGIVSYTFTPSDLTLDPTVEEMFEGFYQLKVTKDDASEEYLTLPQPFVIRRNRTAA